MSPGSIRYHDVFRFRYNQKNGLVAGILVQVTLLILRKERAT